MGTRTPTGNIERPRLSLNYSLGGSRSPAHLKVLSVHTSDDSFSSRLRSLDDAPTGIMNELSEPDGLNETIGAERIKEKIGHVLGISGRKKSKEVDKSTPSVICIPENIGDELDKSCLTYDYDAEVLSKQIKPLIPKFSSSFEGDLKKNLYRNAILKFRVLEKVVLEMQHPVYGIEQKTYKRMFRAYIKVASGQQIHNWIFQRKSFLDKEETSEICSNLYALSYIIPIECRDKFCADTTLYIFQTHPLWLSRIVCTEETDYVIYLLRRVNTARSKYILQEFEDNRLEAYKDKYASEWSNLCARAAKLNDKDHRWKFLLQEYTFWDMHYPRNYKTSKLISIISPNTERSLRMSFNDFEKQKNPNELIKWYEILIESYTYQLNITRTTPFESARLILQRISAATPIDSFLSPAVGYKNVWASTVPTDFFQQAQIPKKISLALWKFSFPELLRSPDGIKCFYDFLSSEFSSENLSFYLECIELDKIFHYDAFVEKATGIFSEFIVSGAPREINIVSSIRQRIISGFQNFTNHRTKLPRSIFSEAMASVLKLMSTDSYVRFCNSNLFKEVSSEKLE